MGKLVNVPKGSKTAAAQRDGYRRQPRRALRTRDFLGPSQRPGEASVSNEAHALLLLQVRPPVQGHS